MNHLTDRAGSVASIILNNTAIINDWQKEQFALFLFPFMHIVDLNRDGRDDILLYEKDRDEKISILLNTGEWKNMSSLERKFPPPDQK